MNEATIRSIVASDLAQIDPQLILVGEEHKITLSDGQFAKIDILSKDRFGCFTVIDIKKSDQTARSAVQQLYKYAHLLKVKYRLRVDQIRCVAASTHWKELRAPFSEFAHFSAYDSLGVQLDIVPPDSYKATRVDTTFEHGGNDAVKNFFFFEFRELADRDVAYDTIIRTLDVSARSLNSVVIKLNAADSELPNPFGFSWIIFRAEQSALDDDLSQWQLREELPPDNFSDESTLERTQLDDRECLLRSLILLKAPIVRAGSGEYTCLALHSLNNTLRRWKTIETRLFGPMFDAGIFSKGDAINLACGFLGDHPYNFVVETATDRPAHFNYVRERLDSFLEANSRWRSGVSAILDSVQEGSQIGVQIFNPLNFCGMLTDMYMNGKTTRIPSFAIIEVRPDGSTIEYMGSLIWRGTISPVSLKKAIDRVYPMPELATSRLINL